MLKTDRLLFNPTHSEAFGIIISRKKRYIEAIITGNGIHGIEPNFISRIDKSVSINPTRTLIIDPNVTHIFIATDKDCGMASKIKISKINKSIKPMLSPF